MGEKSFKEFEQAGWEKSADRYAQGLSRLTDQMIPHVISALRVHARMRAIDIACGPGRLAAALAEKGADTVGVDFAEAMVRRAKSSFPAVSFQSGDAEALDFPDGSFDIAAMNFGILHLAYPERALNEAARILKPGGRFAFTVWCELEKAPGLGVVHDAIQRHGDPSIVLPAGPPFFQYSDVSFSQNALRAAGFEKPTVQEVPLVWRLESPEVLFLTFHEGTARTGGLLRAQPPENLVRIRAEVIEVLRKHHLESDGSVSVAMPAMLYSAEKPRLY